MLTMENSELGKKNRQKIDCCTSECMRWFVTIHSLQCCPPRLMVGPGVWSLSWSDLYQSTRCDLLAQFVYNCLLLSSYCVYVCVCWRSLVELSHFVMVSLIGSVLQGKHLSLCLLKMLIGSNKTHIKPGRWIQCTGQYAAVEHSKHVPSNDYRVY